MKRIMIIGCCGAGKSTLALKLHELLDIQIFHLDQLYFSPNWVEMEKAKWEKTVIELSKEKEWIIDGNYGGTMDFRLQQADTVIFLDYPRWLCMYRVLKRTFLYHGQKRPDMAEGCKERFDLPFLHYVFMFHNMKRPSILKRLANMEDRQKTFIFQNDAEANAFLERIGK